MANINSSDWTRKVIKAINAQAVQVIPTEIKNDVQLTLETNPALYRRANFSRSASGVNSIATAIYTLPDDKDFYLTNIWLGVIKDALATSTVSAITGVLWGDSTAYALISIPGITLTAQSNTLSQSFAFPLLMARGSQFIITCTTNVGNIKASGGIIGYFAENGE